MKAWMGLADGAFSGREVDVIFKMIGLSLLPALQQG